MPENGQLLRHWPHLIIAISILSLQDRNVKLWNFHARTAPNAYQGRTFAMGSNTVRKWSIYARRDKEDIGLQTYIFEILLVYDNTSVVVIILRYCWWLIITTSQLMRIRHDLTYDNYVQQKGDIANHLWEISHDVFKNINVSYDTIK